jgi:hypothetical protein
MITAPFGFLGGGIDPAALAFIQAAGITDQTQKSAINQLVIDLKDAGIWSEFDIIYPFVGGTASSHKYNLINPLDTDAAFRGTFNGTWTHSSDGVKSGASVNNWINTHYNTNTDMVATNFHVSAYINEIGSVSTPLCGTGKEDPAEAGEYLTYASLGVGTQSFYEQGGSFNPAGPGMTPNSASATTNTGEGAFLIGDTGGGNTRLFGAYDTTSFAQIGTTSTGSPGTEPNVDLAIGVVRAVQTGGGIANILYSNNRIAFFSAGNSLGSSQAATLNTIVQQYQTTLAREFTPFTPTKISDLVGWYDAADVTLSGSNVTSWQNLVNTMGNLTSTGSSQATWSATGFGTNSKPYVRALSGGRYVSGINWPSTSASSVYFIFRPYLDVTGGTYNRFSETPEDYNGGWTMLFTDGSGGMIAGFAPGLGTEFTLTQNTPYALRVNWDGTTNLAALNNSAQESYSSAIATQPLTGLSVFNQYNALANGVPFDAAEILIFNKALSSTERNRMANYILNKYNITLTA